MRCVVLVFTLGICGCQSTPTKKSDAVATTGSAEASASTALDPSDHSARADIERMCRAFELSNAPTDDSAARMQHALAWLADNIRNPDVIGIAKVFPHVPVADRGVLFRDAAKEFGYTGPCPMAEHYDKQKLSMAPSPDAQDHSARADLERLCRVEELAGAGPVDEEPSYKAARLVMWFNDNIQAPEVLEMADVIAETPLLKRGPLIRSMAESVGYSGPCPLADKH